MATHTPGPWKWRQYKARAGQPSQVVLLCLPENHANNPVILEAREDLSSLPGVTSSPDYRLIERAPDLLETLSAYRKAYGKLHDILSDCIEGGRLTAADLPDDYQAIVEQLCEPCGQAEEQAKVLLDQLEWPSS